jgi:hypothetical protein
MAAETGDAAAAGDQQRPALVPGSSLDRFHQPFQENLDRLDPARDGWDSEAVNDQTAGPLKVLESVLAAPETDREQLRALITDDFRCGSLRPDKLETVFHDPPITVRRQPAASERAGQSDSSGAAGSSGQGIEGFARAIDHFKQALAVGHVHAHFKTIRVNLEGSTAETISVLQLGATQGQLALQQTSRWTCRWRLPSSAGSARLSDVRVTDFEEVVSDSRAGAAFRDCTEAVLGKVPSFRDQLALGIDDWVKTLERHLGLDIVALHGIALGDVNGDGLEDLFVCEPGGLPNRLYLHKPDGTVRDVSAVAGVDYFEATRSALLLDLDNDGDQDLVMASDRFVVFLSNDGYGRFSQRAGFRTTAATVSMAAADYDLDGDLDVYVCGYFTLEDAAEATVGLGNPIPFHDASNGARNSLYRNDGNWEFRDATDAVGLDADNNRFSLAAAWEDYDNDGDPDLYVANDYGRNCLYRNDGGHFVNVAAAAGVEDISAGMSASWGDYNRDGRLDIYVSNMFSSAGNRIAYQRQFKTDTSNEVRDEYRRFARGNSLFENAGDGSYRDVTDTAHVTLGRWAWASNFVDINNDGWDDLVVANGMLTRDGGTGDL